MPGAINRTAVSWAVKKFIAGKVPSPTVSEGGGMTRVTQMTWFSVFVFIEIAKYKPEKAVISVIAVTILD